jgi:C4-dicarboxylate-specific signal transduction histidine kinase
MTGQVLTVSKTLYREFHLLQRNYELASANERKSKNMLEHERLFTLSRISGGVAHEVNNPLSVITGYAENILIMAQENRLDEARVLRASEKILNAAGRVALIIKSLRRISRDGSKDPFEPTALVPLVDENLAYLKTLFSSAGIEIRRQFPEDEPWVLSQPGELSQALFHVLNNAIDALEGLPEKWILLDLKSEGDLVHLAVTDSGGGIPQPLREHILQPFFTTKAIGKGTGLGLPLANSIIEAHGGLLRLDKESSHTRFLITLPRFRADALRPSVA